MKRFLIEKMKKMLETDKMSERAKLPHRMWIKAQETIEVLNGVQRLRKCYDEKTLKSLVADLDRINTVLEKYTR